MVLRVKPSIPDEDPHWASVGCHNFNQVGIDIGSFCFRGRFKTWLLTSWFLRVGFPRFHVWSLRPRDSSGDGDPLKWNLHFHCNTAGKATYMETNKVEDPKSPILVMVSP